MQVVVGVLVCEAFRERSEQCRSGFSREVAGWGPLVPAVALQAALLQVAVSSAEIVLYPAWCE